MGAITKRSVIGFTERVGAHLLCLAMSANIAAASDSLTIPGCTAYADPNPEPEGLRISERSGLKGWSDPSEKISWFGEIKTPGRMDCAVALRLPADAVSKLRLTVSPTPALTKLLSRTAGEVRALPAAQSHEASARGQGGERVVVSFGSFEIGTGYQRFTLESLNPPGQPAGDLESLLLSGPPAADAHFNLKPRRNAASVHLAYPVNWTNVDAFYCEVTAVDDPVWTFYMACGWHRGYFGMQVNGATERRIIFSVWDSGNEAVDRDKVEAENRVRLVAKGEGVYAGDFGNEGTGGHSHLNFMWKTGEKQRFYITAKPAGTNHVSFSGYYFRPDKREWMLISSWDAPKECGHLRGLHSFSENFGGANGHLRRKALYGNQWVHLANGEWHELTTASFSHDPTGRSDRLDRFMEVEGNQFFLSHGGYIPGTTKFGEKFTRMPVGKPPADVVLQN